MQLKRRLNRLTEILRPSRGPERTKRWVVSLVGSPGVGCPAADLAKSSCMRRRETNGTLTEMVILDGSRDGITDEDLNRFVEGFPIATSTRSI